MAKKEKKNDDPVVIDCMSDLPAITVLPPPTRVQSPGYYDMDMRSYLADPCPEPSISKGVIHDLHYRTMARAWYRHPRGGGGERPDASRADIGTAIHNGVSGGREIVYAPAEFDNWMKGDAKAFRADAYARWQVPLLERQRGFVADTVGKVKELLASNFGELAYERTLCWQGHGVWCRTRADGDNVDVDVDLKSATSANPIEWGKFSAIRGGYDIQAAHREQGHIALTGKPKEMWWLVIEFEAPYDHAVLRVAESMLEIGRKKIAINAPKWRTGLDTGIWPSYGRTILQASSRAEWDLEEHGS